MVHHRMRRFLSIFFRAGQCLMFNTLMSITTATYIIQFKFLVIFTQDYDKFNLVS